MSSSSKITLVASLVASSLLFLLVLPPAGRAGRPHNVLILVVDALRADHLRSYGYGRDLSPRIDELAGRGTRFRRALSQATWTLPSVASLFLSQYVSAHGVEHPDRRIPDAAETLAERMRDLGFRTGGFVLQTYTSAEFGMDQGFDTFMSGGDPAEQTARFLHWVDAAPSPFFSYIHFLGVHHPYVNPNPYRPSYGAGYVGPVNGTDPLGKWRRQSLTPEGRQHLVDLYDNEVSAIDRQLGILFDALAARGRLESTLIVLTADHGEAFFEHGSLSGHRGPPYQELVHVPLILAGPGIPKGQVVDDWVETVDLAPTILEAAGGAPGNRMQGQSLSPFFTGAPDRKPYVFAECLPLGAAAVIGPRWKLLVTRDGPPQLFDLQEDPGEFTDRATAQVQVVRALTAILERFREGNRSVGAGAAPASPLSEETLQKLRALGYVQ